MKHTSSRFLLAAILFGTFSLGTAGSLAGCGGGDSSSPAPSTTSDAGTDAEASAPEDAKPDTPVQETGPTPEAAPDVEPDTEPDSDGDGVPDSLDACPGFDDHDDGDGDGIADGCDVCPTGDNDVDSDGDGNPDDCDICPGFDEAIDTNGSGVPDCREAMKLWLRADRAVFADDGAGGVGAAAVEGDLVREWRDQSVWSGNGTQTDPNRQPTFAESILPSGGSAVHFEGSAADTTNDDSLDGPFFVSAKAARTVFMVARTAAPVENSSIFEMNRTGTTAGSNYRITPEIGVRVGSGSAMFSNQPLDDQFHVITVQNPANASSSDIRAWYDGIPVSPSSVAARAIDTGNGGYRLGDGNVLGDAGFTGDVAELIVYEDALSEDERATVGLTLERKHGLKSWYVDNTLPVQVYLLAGQSNMVGQGEGTELASPLNATQGDVMAWMSDAVGWTPLRYGGGNGPTQFGPELGFGRAMADDDPDSRVAMIKHAVNGTSLAVDWNPASGAVYAGFVSTVTQSRQRLEDLGIEYEIKGLLWMQGESDAIDPLMADAYQTNMEAFIAEVRTLVAVPDLPVIIGRIRGNMPSPFVYSLAVRLAQESVAAGDPNVKVIDTDNLTLLMDGVHYDTAGQIQLGQLFADAVK